MSVLKKSCIPHLEMDDAVNMGLHYILQYLDTPGTYARVLFDDFSLAFNTIDPWVLRSKLTQLTVPAPISSGSLTSWQTGGSRWGWGTSHPAPRPSALEPPRDMCSPLLDSVRLLKFADDTTVIGLIWDGDKSAYTQEVDSWPSGAVRTTWSWIRSKLWRWQWTSGGAPQYCRPPPPYHTQQHCVCYGNLQVSEIHNLPGPKVDTQHRHCHQKGLAEDVLPAPAQEVKPASLSSLSVSHSHVSVFSSCLRLTCLCPLPVSLTSLSTCHSPLIFLISVALLFTQIVLAEQRHVGHLTRMPLVCMVR